MCLETCKKCLERKFHFSAVREKKNKIESETEYTSKTGRRMESGHFIIGNVAKCSMTQQTLLINIFCCLPILL